ncbi:hypothetical protein GGR44_000891 [Sphingobium fontiphilum]|uniref:Uncharacterized protein n=1 Tax=Sphingobium fontiphilum TaxID=944425 RepID=A0A7W6GPP9_9SPHN|nr:hypothetical protein [Sphingobium fontiphilum]MBB3981244.1 hypothetical protein [Sphingobium fontiphilum]
MTGRQPGLDGVKGMPHYSVGMVAMGQVGKLSSALPTSARPKREKLPRFADKPMTALLARIKKARDAGDLSRSAQER